MSGYQLGPFEVGQIKAHVEHGLGCNAISKRLFKPDGKSHWTETAIVNAMSKLKQDKSWRGERQEGSGPPRLTTPKQDRAVVRWVLKIRGKNCLLYTSDAADE